MAAKRAGAFSVIGSHGAIAAPIFAKLAKRVTAGDPISARVLSQWEARKGFPRTSEVPLRDLVLASLEVATDERALYPPIRRQLQTEG